MRVCSSRGEDRRLTEIVQIVVEGVLNFLTNLQETDEQEGREGSSRDGDVSHGLDNLERQEEEVHPERHAKVGLVREGERRRADTLEIGECILENIQVGLEGSGNGGLNKSVAHQESGVAAAIISISRAPYEQRVVLTLPRTG